MNSFVKSTDTSNRNGVIINDSPTYTRPFQDHATSKSRMSRNMFGENIVGGATCKRKSRHYSPLKVLFFALKSGLTGNCQLPHLITGEESENPADRFARLLDMPLETQNSHLVIARTERLDREPLEMEPQNEGCQHCLRSISTFVWHHVELVERA
jgi:hypothetical protein